MTPSLCKIQRAACTKRQRWERRRALNGHSLLPPGRLPAHRLEPHGHGRELPQPSWAPGIPSQSEQLLPQHCCTTTNLLYSENTTYRAVGLFAVICLNGLYSCLQSLKTFSFNRKFLFFFFPHSFQYQLQNCLKSQSHVKILTPTFNDFHFHPNSLIHLTSSLLGYCSCIHTSTSQQCFMACSGITPWWQTNCNVTTTIIVLNGLHSLSRSKETAFFFFPSLDYSFPLQNTIHGFMLFPHCITASQRRAFNSIILIKCTSLISYIHYYN